MAAQTQRIQRRYVSGVGTGGGLLAVALIGFVSVVGMVSLAFWPQAGSDHTGGDSATLAPARSASQPGEASAPASTPAGTTVRPGAESTGARSGGGSAAKGGGGHKAEKPAAPPTNAAAPPATGGSGDAPAAGNPTQTISPSTSPSARGGSSSVAGSDTDSASHGGRSSVSGHSGVAVSSHGHSSGHSSGHATGQGNGQANGQANGHSNGR
jgi:hypothetical protein